MDVMESPKACPKCGVRRWWTEYRVGGTGAVVLLGAVGRPAFSFCYNCGYQKAEAMEPVPWPAGTVFPMPADPDFDD